MKTASKGRRAEYKTIKLLTSQGYVCTRSAASKGIADIIAIRHDEVRLVQVKSNWPATKEERLRFSILSAPACVRKYIYQWMDWAKEPKIIPIDNFLKPC